MGIPSYALPVFYCCGSLVLVMVSVALLGMWSAAGRSRRDESRLYGQVGHARPAVLPEDDSELGAENAWERRDHAVRARRRRRNVRFGLYLLPVAILIGTWLIYIVWQRDQAPTPQDAIGNVALAVVVGVGCLAAASFELWGSTMKKPPAEHGLMSEQMALRAHPVHPGSAPELERALANMAVATGNAVPGLYLVDAASANAMIFSDGSLGITQGMSDLLEAPEFCPVFAWLFVRRAEPDVIETEDYVLRAEEGEWTDAEAFRLAGDPTSMLRAWKKIMNAENRVMGSERLPDANFLVPPGERAEWRGRRIALVGKLAGAMGVDSPTQ